MSLHNKRTMEFAGDLSLQLLTLHRSLHNLFITLLNQTELSQHYQLLFTLTRLGGIATQTELVQSLKAGESTTRASINVLQKKGYLTREKHNKHNRTQIVKLTTKAVQKMPDLWEAMKKVDDLAFRDLTETSLFQLWTIMIKINENMTMIAPTLTK